MILKIFLLDYRLKQLTWISHQKLKSMKLRTKGEVSEGKKSDDHLSDLN